MEEQVYLPLWVPRQGLLSSQRLLDLLLKRKHSAERHALWGVLEPDTARSNESRIHQQKLSASLQLVLCVPFGLQNA